MITTDKQAIHIEQLCVWEQILSSDGSASVVSQYKKCFKLCIV